MQYKSREWIPVWGTVLILIGTVLVLGVLPAIPVFFYTRFNNKYVNALQNNDTAMLEYCEKKMRLCRNVAIIITIITIIVEVFVFASFAFNVFQAVQENLEAGCVGCPGK